MNLAEAMTKIGPELASVVAGDDNDRALDPAIDSDDSSVLFAVRAAYTGDRGFFKPLPAMLTHTDPRASSNKLYGGTRSSPVEFAAYRPGAFADIPHGQERVYHGAAMYDINSVAYPVLIYTATGEKAFCSGANQKGPGELHVPAVKNPEKQSKNHGNQ